MGTITFNIVSGLPPFTAELIPSAVPSLTDLSLGQHTFLDVPDGTYDLLVTDSMGCEYYISSAETEDCVLCCSPTNIFQYAVSSIVVGGVMFVGERKNNPYIVRFANPDNLTSYSLQTVSDVEGLESVCYSPSTGKIYFGARDSFTGNLVIIELNPATLAYTKHVISGISGNSCLITIGGTFIYGANPTTFFKIRISDWTDTTHNYGGMYDIGVVGVDTVRQELYVADSGNNVSIVKTYDLSNYSVIDISSFVSSPSGLVSYNGIVAIAGQAPVMSYGAAVIDIDDTVVTGMLLMPSNGLWSDGSKVYSANILEQVDVFDIGNPSLVESSFIELDFIPSEILFVSGRVFLTKWGDLSESKLCEFVCLPDVTTTTTSSTSSTSTTTSTTTICVRPPTIQIAFIRSWYMSGYGWTYFDEYASSEACDEFLTYTSLPYTFGAVTYFEGEMEAFAVGNQVYEGYGDSSCNCLPEGTYWVGTSLPSTADGFTVHEWNCVYIVEVKAEYEGGDCIRSWADSIILCCNVPTTTTTSTTAEPTTTTTSTTEEPTTTTSTTTEEPTTTTTTTVCVRSCSTEFRLYNELYYNEGGSLDIINMSLEDACDALWTNCETLTVGGVVGVLAEGCNEPPQYGDTIWNGWYTDNCDVVPAGVYIYGDYDCPEECFYLVEIDENGIVVDILICCVPTTTTTSTTLEPTTTTTSTTLYPPSTTTTTTLCARDCVEEFMLSWKINYTDMSSIDIHLMTLEEACDALWTNCETKTTMSSNSWQAEGCNIPPEIDDKLWYGWNTNDCTVFPEGVYLYGGYGCSEPYFYLVEVGSDGIVEDILICYPPTTTTTTTLEPTTTTTSTTIPPIPPSCDEIYSINLGTQSYPTCVNVLIGSDIGCVYFDYRAYDIPDRFILSFDGDVVVDTGYVGNASYFAIGGIARGLFTASLTGLIDPITGHSYPNFTDYPDDGYPNVINFAGSTAWSTTYFIKNTVTDIITVCVYAPMDSTVWDIIVRCPQVCPTTTTTTIEPTTTTTTTICDGGIDILEISFPTTTTTSSTTAYCVPPTASPDSSRDVYRPECEVGYDLIPFDFYGFVCNEGGTIANIRIDYIPLIGQLLYNDIQVTNGQIIPVIGETVFEYSLVYYTDALIEEDYQAMIVYSVDCDDCGTYSSTSTLTFDVKTCITTTTTTTLFPPSTTTTTSSSTSSTTTTTTTGETTTTTTTEFVGCVEYGYLYNWYAVNDARNIANTGWHVPTIAEARALYWGISDAGGKMKETGTTYWNSPNVGATNEYGLGLRGSGLYDQGVFSSLREVSYHWIALSYGYYFLCYYGSDVASEGTGSKNIGCGIRLVKDNDTVANYTGNDGKIYKTVKIGSTVWMSENLAETEYRDHTEIPYISDNGTWAALSTGARISYNNDCDYVGCGELCPTTTTTTTVCERPVCLQEAFIAAWWSESVWHNISTETSEEACAMFDEYKYREVFGDEILSYWEAEFEAMSIGEIAYRNYNSDDCDERVPDGVYWYNSSLDIYPTASDVKALECIYMVTVESGIITDISDACCPTTTTSTTEEQTTTTSTTSEPTTTTTTTPEPTTTTTTTNAPPVSYDNSMNVYRSEACVSENLELLVVDFPYTDIDGGDLTNVQIVTVPVIGTLQYQGNPLVGGEELVVEFGTDFEYELRYFANDAITGYYETNFTFRVKTEYCDDYSNTSTITLNVFDCGITTTTSTSSSTTTTSTTVCGDKCDYGLMYNWYTVNTGKLAPVGWRVPSLADFTTLQTYLGGETIGGGKLKVTGTCYWWSPNTGATNEYGFFALPGGYRYAHNGAFGAESYTGLFWSTTEYAFDSSYSMTLLYSSSKLFIGDSGKKDAFAVRCVRDFYVGWEEDIPVIDYDGNEYGIIEIGTQLWLGQNLKVTHYNDGEIIPNVESNIEWTSLTTGALCAYNNDWSTYVCLSEPTTSSTTTSTTTIFDGPEAKNCGIEIERAVCSPYVETYVTPDDFDYEFETPVRKIRIVSLEGMTHAPYLLKDDDNYIEEGTELDVVAGNFAFGVYYAWDVEAQPPYEDYFTFQVLCYGNDNWSNVATFTIDVSACPPPEANVRMINVSLSQTQNPNCQIYTGTLRVTTEGELNYATVGFYLDFLGVGDPSGGEELGWVQQGERRQTTLNIGGVSYVQEGEGLIGTFMMSYLPGTTDIPFTLVHVNDNWSYSRFVSPFRVYLVEGTIPLYEPISNVTNYTTHVVNVKGITTTFLKITGPVKGNRTSSGEVFWYYIERSPGYTYTAANGYKDITINELFSTDGYDDEKSFVELWWQGTSTPYYNYLNGVYGDGDSVQSQIKTVTDYHPSYTRYYIRNESGASADFEFRLRGYLYCEAFINLNTTLDSLVVNKHILSLKPYVDTGHLSYFYDYVLHNVKIIPGNTSLLSTDVFRFKIKAYCVGGTYIQITLHHGRGYADEVVNLYNGDEWNVEAWNGTEGNWSSDFRFVAVNYPHSFTLDEFNIQIKTYAGISGLSDSGTSTIHFNNVSNYIQILPVSSNITTIPSMYPTYFGYYGASINPPV